MSLWSWGGYATEKADKLVELLDKYIDKIQERNPLANPIMSPTSEDAREIVKLIREYQKLRSND